MLLLRENPPKDIRWMKMIQSPERYLRGYTGGYKHIECVIGGLKPWKNRQDCVWGKLPNRTGFLTFFTDCRGIKSQAIANPDIFYYIECENTKKLDFKIPHPSLGSSSAGRPNHEPYRSWDEAEIRRQLIQICEKVSHGISLEEACMLHGISMWSFKHLFQIRYPGEYYEWTNYNKIPKADNLAETLVKRFPTLSSTC